jgi:hypothetical protein
LRTLHPHALFAIVANGGPGDDLLAGGGTRMQGYEGALDGGGGRNQLYGGPFSDYLTDGDRDGAQDSGAPGPDVLDGGRSNDAVRYQQRTAAVRVDLASDRPAGERNEGDTVRNIESVFGGAGADQLSGTNGPNLLAGGPGHDRLVGRGGDDGFGGAAFGGIWLSTPIEGTAAGDAISCGSGVDSIWRPERGEYIEPRCEALTLPSGNANAYPALHGRSLTEKTVCPIPEESRDTCSGTVTIRDTARRHRLLAAGAIPRTGGETGILAHLRLTTTGRRLAARRQGVLATIRIRGHNLPRASWKIRLKLPS